MWKIVVIILVVLAGIFIYTQNNSESNAQKLSECKLNANRIHDIELATAPENTADGGTQHSQNSELAYTKRIASCQANYGKK